MNTQLMFQPHILNNISNNISNNRSQITYTLNSTLSNKSTLDTELKMFESVIKNKMTDRERLVVSMFTVVQIKTDYMIDLLEDVRTYEQFDKLTVKPKETVFWDIAMSRRRDVEEAFISFDKPINFEELFYNESLIKEYRQFFKEKLYKVYTEIATRLNIILSVRPSLSNYEFQYVTNATFTRTPLIRDIKSVKKWLLKNAKRFNIYDEVKLYLKAPYIKHLNSNSNNKYINQVYLTTSEVKINSFLERAILLLSY